MIICQIEQALIFVQIIQYESKPRAPQTRAGSCRSAAFPALPAQFENRKRPCLQQRRAVIAMISTVRFRGQRIDRRRLEFQLHYSLLPRCEMLELSGRFPFPVNFDLRE